MQRGTELVDSSGHVKRLVIWGACFPLKVRVVGMQCKGFPPPSLTFMNDSSLRVVQMLSRSAKHTVSIS